MIYTRKRTTPLFILENTACIVPESNLVCAIYRQAVFDYVRARITGEREEEDFIARFITSGTYGYEYGDYLLHETKRQYGVCVAIIKWFLDSEEYAKILTSQKIAVPVMKEIISAKYRKKLSFAQVDSRHPGQYILRKKGKKYGQKKKMV